MKSPEVLVTVPPDLGFPFTMSIEKWNSGGLCSKPFKSGLGLHPGKRISAFLAPAAVGLGAATYPDACFIP
jgi:hypothetical protein